MVQRLAGGAVLLAATFAVVVATAVALGRPSDGAGRTACPQRETGAGYASRVAAALRGRRDVWGNALLRAPNGPTYEAARRFLRPLLFARAAGHRPLTESGVYYLPFGVPAGDRGALSVALHVADGSQIVSRRVGGRSLTVLVGPGGRERYGSCLARLSAATLADGWLPILDTGYTDTAGARYRQESFAAHLPATNLLASFVRIAVDTRRARGAVSVRLTPSHGGGPQLRLGPGGTREGSSAVYRVARGTTRTVYVAWLARAAPTPGLTLDDAGYAVARDSVVRYWQARLAGGMTIDVPERRVADAAQALLVQELLLTWRYSSGNPYEQFSFPEGVDVAQVVGELGFGDVARAILRTSLTRRLAPYPNWKMGEELLVSASQFRLFADGEYIERAMPALRRYVVVLGRQIDRNRSGLLSPERYSSDIPDSVLGLHSQAVVWAGLEGMARVWARTGQTGLAATCRRLAARLEAALRRAVRASEVRLADGSLFVPVRLLAGERPYGSVTEERLGSYWNLVMPYALASGLFAPGSVEARGTLRYLDLHGTRLLGLVRAGAYALYGEHSFPAGGTDQVYGINLARFLADNDQADQLVLSLYGMLAAAMTPGTFVSGEAASVAPLPGADERAMYLPPNGAADAAFLETLRLLLVQELRDPSGRPRGLRLAPATPRGWLRQGARIAVRHAPTSFGPVSFSIDSGADSADVLVDAPRRSAPASLTLRLRLPHGRRIARVTLGGRPFRRFDARTGTIDLSGRRGSIRLRVVYGT